MRMRQRASFLWELIENESYINYMRKALIFGLGKSR